jgi:hypothetical protein
VIFILPETKGVSLERMDAIFGELDYVEAREMEVNGETTAYNPARAGSVKEKAMTVVKEEKEEKNSSV